MNHLRIPTPTEKLKEMVHEMQRRLSHIEERLHRLENKGIDE